MASRCQYAVTPSTLLTHLRTRHGSHPTAARPPWPGCSSGPVDPTRVPGLPVYQGHGCPHCPYIARTLDSIDTHRRAKHREQDTLAWLHQFDLATIDRTKQDEKRYLIFDGHGAHLTLEFLQYCEDNKIISFGFLPHTTHLCQPLDGKPFLAYKQQFRLANNELSFWGGQPYEKAEFLQIIQPIREKAFTQRIIRESFKDRGIWPVNGELIVKQLANEAELPDIAIPEGLRDTTPPQLLSSSVENSPPATIEALARNQAKIMRDLDLLSEKAKRNLTKVFHHQMTKLEELQMTQQAIYRITAVQEPKRRNNTKRQIKGLSSNGILRVQDAIRSIKVRKEKDLAREQKRLSKQFKKVYGWEPTPRSEESIQQEIENARRAEEAGEDFYIDK
ncbi:hypothetical protein ASPCAL02423 [Aspergillus calidoustus]|uniref:Uncharacterized protein n=1 Tax=Aspergillus calidoustus TaxID=454130 RepID=A0A0U5GM67_ASPCI|nr:hypothetical protein ASPCAL02423 [Aspergillus calidoustus]